MADFARTLEPELLHELDRVALHKHFDEGELLIDYGQEIAFVPIVTAGRISVYSVDPKDGNELYLYSILPDETCSMTVGCCMYRQPSSVKAVAETDVEALLVPHAYLADWMNRFPGFRTYVYQTMSGRMLDMIRVIEALAFQNLPQRLIEYLRNKVKEQGSRLVNMSHEQVAQALGTSRVVISRLLKQLEKEEKVLLFRNQIKVMPAL